MNKSATAQCATAVSLFRGLYARVARDLGVDVSYVSRIARGERKSEAAKKALTREFNKAVSVMTNALIRSSKKLYVEVGSAMPALQDSPKYSRRCPSCVRALWRRQDRMH
jgi:transcriptional regulator with XRE-family HTH domain